MKRTKYTALSYQGNTNQNTLRSNIIPVRMATRKKKKKNPHRREDVRKTALMYCWQECELSIYYGNDYGEFSKITNTDSTQ